MHLIFRNAQFRLFWTAGMFGDVSLITHFTVHGWLALLVTDSPFWVGATAGVGGIAMTVFAPWGGVLIDRFRKVDVIRLASLLRGTSAAALAVLVFTDSSGALARSRLCGCNRSDGCHAGARYEDPCYGHRRRRAPSGRNGRTNGFHDGRRSRCAANDWSL